jgi:hypothetical protein
LASSFLEVNWRYGSWRRDLGVGFLFISVVCRLGVLQVGCFSFCAFL